MANIAYNVSNISRFTGINVQPESNDLGVINNSDLHGFYVPSLTTAQITTLVATPEMNNGAVIYDNVLNIFRVWQNGALYTLGTTNGTVTGVGLTSGSPFVFPQGPSAAVEVVANQVNGFTYYNTTANTMRIYFNGAWAGWTIP